MVAAVEAEIAAAAAAMAAMVEELPVWGKSRDSRGWQIVVPYSPYSVYDLQTK